MKRFLVLGLTLLLTLSLLTGCKGKGNVSDNSAGKITEDTSATTPMSSVSAPTVPEPSEGMTEGATDSEIVAPSGRNIH